MREYLKIKFVITLLTVLLVGCSGSKEYSPEVGDVVFQISQSRQSKAIQLATKSPYSHVGVIVEVDGKVYVAEAIAKVSLTPLEIWIERGKDNHFVVKRLKENRVIESFTFYKETNKYLGKAYDLEFNWSDDKFYCSELVWKIFDRNLRITLSTLDSLGSYDLTHPIVREKLKQRYGELIPYNEPVVAPSDIYNSILLEEIYRE